MEAVLLTSIALLWILVFALAFLLLGALRSQGVLRWQLAQLEATTPNRHGRSGLKPGKPAPDFTLPAVGGGEVSFGDFAGKSLLLVFVQPRCGPCHDIAPELNRLARGAGPRVLVVINADLAAGADWARDVKAEFPVAVQDRWKVSKSYEIHATPFAFLISADGRVRSNGIAGCREYLGYVLANAGSEPDQAESGPGRTDTKDGIVAEPVSQRETSHV